MFYIEFWYSAFKKRTSQPSVPYMLSVHYDLDKSENTHLNSLSRVSWLEDRISRVSKLFKTANPRFF